MRVQLDKNFVAYNSHRRGYNYCVAPSARAGLLALAAIAVWRWLSAWDVV